MPKPVWRQFDANGDGSGAKNLAVNGTSPTQSFYIRPRAGEMGVEVHRLIVKIEDAGAFTATTYGFISKLTNGVLLRKVAFDRQTRTAGAVIQDLLDGLPIQSNGDWGRESYDVQFLSEGGGNTFLLARWTLAAAGAPLNIDTDEALEVVIQDDLTGLVEHYIQMQGMAY